MSREVLHSRSVVNRSESIQFTWHAFQTKGILIVFLNFKVTERTSLDVMERRRRKLLIGRTNNLPPNLCYSETCCKEKFIIGFPMIASHIKISIYKLILHWRGLSEWLQTIFKVTDETRLHECSISRQKNHVAMTHELMREHCTVHPL